MAEEKQTPEEIRNERDQLRSQVEALGSQCAAMTQAKQQELAAAADEVAKLKVALEKERSRGAESLGLAAQWEKKVRAALARDDESYAALQAIAQVAGRLINRRQGAREVNTSAGQ